MPGVALASRVGLPLSGRQIKDIATFHVRISPEGRVLEARPGNLPEDEAEALAGIVHSLRFTPFEVNGVFVSAEGVLPLLILDGPGAPRILAGY